MPFLWCQKCRLWNQFLVIHNLCYSTFNGLVPQDRDPDIETLRLYKLPIPEVNETSFVRYRNLTSLVMVRCSLVRVKDGTFDLLWKLGGINLMNNKIIEFPQNFGLASQSITHVQFWAAFRLSVLPPFYFKNFSKLTKLNIGGNRWKQFDPSILPENLTHINLNYAHKGKQFPIFTDWAPNLKFIIIAGNKIEELPAENIRNVKVTKINIENNRLTTIPEYTAYPYIECLKLKKNRLTSLPDFFNTSLTSLTLSQNPLNCDQALCWLRMWPWMFDTSILLDNPMCASPDTEAGKSLIEVKPTSMKCYNGRSSVHLFLFIQSKLASNISVAYLQRDSSFYWIHCVLLLLFLSLLV